MSIIEWELFRVNELIRLTDRDAIREDKILTCSKILDNQLLLPSPTVSLSKRLVRKEKNRLEGDKGLARLLRSRTDRKEIEIAQKAHLDFIDSLITGRFYLKPDRINGDVELWHRLKAANLTNLLLVRELSRLAEDDDYTLYYSLTTGSINKIQETLPKAISIEIEYLKKELRFKDGETNQSRFIKMINSSHLEGLTASERRFLFWHSAFNLWDGIESVLEKEISDREKVRARVTYWDSNVLEVEKALIETKDFFKSMEWEVNPSYVYVKGAAVPKSANLIEKDHNGKLFFTVSDLLRQRFHFHVDVRKVNNEELLIVSLNSYRNRYQELHTSTISEIPSLVKELVNDAKFEQEIVTQFTT